MRRRNTPESLWLQVKKTDSCWLWQGYRERAGYGVFRLSGASIKAHRQAWINTYGPIPEGLYVCHKCDNPPCVNPTHLFLGAPRDNSRDAAQKGRIKNGDQRGESNNAAKLSLQLMRRIKRARESGLSYRAIGARFKISHTHARHIATGLRWQHTEAA